MSRQVTVGLVGCGGWCQNYHIPLLIQEMPSRFRVVGVCDTLAELTARGAELTDAPGYGSVEELLDRADPELVCGSTGSCTLSPPFDLHNKTGSLEVDIAGIQRGREGEDCPAFTIRLDLVHYHERLYRAIVDGAPLPVAAAGARNAIALITLLVEAAATQRTVTVPANFWMKED